MTIRTETTADAEYAAWLERREASLPSAGEARLLAQRAGAPRLAVYITDEIGGASDARRTLASQHYPLWRPLVAEDISGALREFLEGDEDYLVFVRSDCHVERHALHEVADVAGRDEPDLIYADEDEVGLNGIRRRPFFKPGWSPELLLSMDYAGPFVALGRAAARSALDVAAHPLGSIEELLLCLVDESPTTARVPDVLFSRPLGGDVGTGGDGVATALRRVAERRCREMDVVPLDIPGGRHVAWKLAGTPRVSVVIATAFNNGHFARCLDSLRNRTTYENIEVVVVATDETPAGLELPGTNSRVVPYDGEFNYSSVCNLGASAATGDFILFLNDDTVAETPDWIEQLLVQAQQPGVGVAGAKLLYPDGTLQLAGVLLLDDQFGARQLGIGRPGDDPGYRGLYRVVRNTSAVSGAAMLVARDVFEAVRGFDEEIAVELGDVDLCLRIIASGNRVVWTPHAVLRHEERGTRAAGKHARDHARFRQRWARLIASGDPYYNPNLSTWHKHEFEIDDRRPAKLAAVYGLPPAAGEKRPSAERYVPEAHRGLIGAEHEARYRWAAAVVRGKDVLDAGCGVGYGSELLARAGAARVVGVDVSVEAVADASDRAADHAEFAVGDLQALPFPSRSFDVIVCFEAIEHVDSGGLVFDEFARLLRPDGLALLSSPNRNVYLPGNPHHVHEYTPWELADELARRFQHVQVYRQHPWLASAITREPYPYEGSSNGMQRGADVTKVAAIAPGEEVYTLVAASDGPIPELRDAVVITSTAELDHWPARVRELQGLIESLEGSLSWRITQPLREAKARLRRHT